MCADVLHQHNVRLLLPQVRAHLVGLERIMDDQTRLQEAAAASREEPYERWVWQRILRAAYLPVYLSAC